MKLTKISFAFLSATFLLGCHEQGSDVTGPTSVSSDAVAAAHTGAPVTYDAALYTAIKNKIQLCHVVLVVAGVYSTYSKWINKEIEIAQFEHPPN